MTNRGRKLAALFITLVVLGLVLNNISARMRTGQETSAAQDESTPAPRPLSPLYVPRPASLISGGYGGLLTVDSSPQDVAQAFAGAYVQYDPDDTTPEDFVSGLPRLASDATSKVSGQLPDDYDTYLEEAGDSPTVTSVSDPDPADEENGTAEVSVVMNTGDDSEALRIALTLEESDAGWFVTSVDLDGV
ncbi:hypothetical protein [Streptomyces sp. NPDC059786]|uniref:hypothetical protein n=1 Tax=Streptomyces sp. NPDC059786 TaxID=3346946 RepID=UPI0036626BE3